MAQLDIDPSDISISSLGLKGFLRRRLREITGLVLLLVIALGALCLASWSITDPSFNNAADVLAKNYLGIAGAIIADLAMQIFGLGILVFLVPPLFWAFQLMGHIRLNHMPWRLVAWLAAAALEAGFLAALPVTKSWPLTTGLGGIIGDKMLSAGNWVFVLGIKSPGLANFCSAGVFLVAACVLVIYAAGFRAIPTMRDIDDDIDALDFDTAGSAMDGFGALTHSLLSIKAFFRRNIWWFWRLIWPFARRSNLKPRPVAPHTAPKGSFVARWLYVFFGERKSRPIKRVEPHFASSGNVREQQFEDDFAEQISTQPSLKVGAPAQALRQAGYRKPAKSRNKYKLPSLSLLSAPKSRKTNPELTPGVLMENARNLENILDDFGIRGEIINVNPGPVVTLYELEPAPGIKSSRIIGLADDIARSMSAISARVAVVPGRNIIGIELPNSAKEMVYLRELLASEAYRNLDHGLSLALGKNIGGDPVFADLARMPHLLIAGTTGSGKSVGINTMVLSLLFRHSPEKCKLIMIDPKMLELSVYDGIPHLLTPVVTDPKKAVVALKWTVREMEDRYKRMSKIGVRNIDGFNARIAQARAKGEIITRTVQTGFDADSGQPIYEEEQMELEHMPYIVVIIDEMADLMMVAGKEIEGTVQRLAQMARAAGIHMITATQRPSVDVITGTIKANFPTRISFQVTSKIDSRTILGEQGAEQLLGQGDMLFMAGGGRVVRVHGPFVSDSEVEHIVTHLKKQGMPEYLEAITQEPEGDTQSASDIAGGEPGDDLYEQALEIVARDNKASTSYLQRRLSIGYNRAATIIERMEDNGVVSPANHAGKREVLLNQPEDGMIR